MQGVGINYVSVLFAAIASFILGGLWYSPFLFDNLWAKLSNFSKADMAKAKKKSMTPQYFATFIYLLIMAFVLSLFISFAEAATMAESLEVAFWLWLGFIATTTLSTVLWEGKSFKLYLLHNAHNLVSLLIMAAVMAAW
jgi:hypothetical protein